MVNRKLIRPSLSDIKDQMPRYGPVPRKRVPPEVTNADNCIKVHRSDGPNLLILKHVIKYMYKQNEDQEPDEVDLE
jgi:hypothetical protein